MTDLALYKEGDVLTILGTKDVTLEVTHADQAWATLRTMNGIRWSWSIFMSEIPYIHSKTFDVGEGVTCSTWHYNVALRGPDVLRVIEDSGTRMVLVLCNGKTFRLQRETLFRRMFWEKKPWEN